MQIVTNQQEFDAAVKAGAREMEIVGDCTLVVTSADELCLVVNTGAPRVEARESSQPRVEARESSQPRVVAWGSSQPRVVARESSQPRVVAWGSSQPRVEAWESSQPRVEAWGSSQPRVEAWESSQPRVEAWGYVQLSVTGRLTVTAGPMVAVLIDGDATVDGGQQTRIAPRETAEAWCAYYGLPVADGVVTLFKAVRGNYASGHDAAFFWTPGTRPQVERLDEGECSYGLHACAHPLMALEFYDAADVRFIACPVRLEDIRVTARPTYPTKVKFQQACAPVWECDRDGAPVPATEQVG